jgi:glutathione-regulated potassium-efflux system ancillary protein KefF
MILLIYAHPHHSRSIAQRILLDAVRDLPQVNVHALYDRYPDFSIDIAADRALLTQARLVIWQHPLHWYAPPALLKLWFEAVLTRGWAFGDGGDALAGKQCLWVTSTGALAESYQPDGLHQHAFEAFVPAVKQTAQFCRMRWLEPIVVHGAHRVERAVLERHAAQYRARLEAWLSANG